MKKCWTFSSGYNFGYGTEEEKPMTLSLCTSRDFLPEDGHGRMLKGEEPGSVEAILLWKVGSGFAFLSLSFSFGEPITCLIARILSY